MLLSIKKIALNFTKEENMYNIIDIVRLQFEPSNYDSKATAVKGYQVSSN
jgi:hypothetical protein